MSQKSKNDDKTFQAMSVPFETAENADTAIMSFYDELYELRCKHKILNVSVIVKDSIQDEGPFLWSAHIGSELEQESMAAWYAGQSSARRQEIIRQAMESGARNSISAADKKR